MSSKCDGNMDEDLDFVDTFDLILEEEKKFYEDIDNNSESDIMEE